jgi:hypothetical protein
VFCRILPFVLLAALAGCGGLPRPFEGNPGARAVALSQPPPARLSVMRPNAVYLADPAAGALAAAIAAALVEMEVPAIPDITRKGDWRLAITAEPRGDMMVPLYTVQDAGGVARAVTEGQPIKTATWLQGSPTTIKLAADEAAPRVANLLSRIEAERLQSDPTSLMNRPTRVAFTGVTGAPGDGNISLARQMRSVLGKLGPVLQDKPEGADFTLVGRVVVVPIAGNQIRVEIQWIINDMANRERGRVVQLNEVPRGTLDNFWGDVAVVVAEEAAGGVRDVLLNQTAAATPPAAALAAPAPAAAPTPTTTPTTTPAAAKPATAPAKPQPARPARPRVTTS